MARVLHDVNYTVKDIQTKPASRNPGAPFTTSTLQQRPAVGWLQRAANHDQPSACMNPAKSPTCVPIAPRCLVKAIKAAEQYITKSFAPRYHQVRQYKTKNSSAQEAHEAIRPTDFNVTAAGADDQQKKLYQLIWQRAPSIANGARRVERTEVTITVSDHSETFLAKGEVLNLTADESLRRRQRRHTATGHSAWPSSASRLCYCHRIVYQAASSVFRGQPGAQARRVRDRSAVYLRANH